MFGKVFKKCIRMCVNVGVDLGSQKKNGPNNCSCIRAHDTWILTSYDSTLWNSVNSAN